MGGVLVDGDAGTERTEIVDPADVVGMPVRDETGGDGGVFGFEDGG